jgi:hypothetical protein
VRLLARTIDYTAATALVVPLWFAAYNYLQAKAADLPNNALEKAFWALLRGDADNATKAALEPVNGLWGQLKLIALLLVLAHLLLPVLHDWAGHAFFGRTLGKAALGIKVVPTREGAAGAKVGVGRSTRRTLLGVFVPWAALMLMWWELMMRQWALAGVLGLVGLIGFVDPLLVLGPRRRTMSDRVANTRVVRVVTLERARLAAVNLPGQANRGARMLRERIRRPGGN